MNVIDLEKPMGVIVSLGGQTAINLASSLAELNVPILGTGVEAIEKAENRDAFEKVVTSLGVPQPNGQAVTISKMVWQRLIVSVIRYWFVLLMFWEVVRCRLSMMMNN